MHLKNAFRTALNRLGFDVIHFRQSPKRTLLGLVDVDIGTIIDVGANEGQFARMISTSFPQAKLYCFEPLSEPFRQLYAWAQTQNGRVKCSQIALGEQEGEIEINHHEHHTPSSSFLRATETCHELYPQTKAKNLTRVKVSTLDTALGDVLDKNPLKILLKLDVQGFEDRVLRGGRRLLHQCLAVVLEVCIADLYEGQANFLTLIQLLNESGFHYAGNLDQAYGNDGRVLFLDAVFVR